MIPKRYNLSNLLRALREPSRFREEVLRLIVNTHFKIRYKRGDDFMNKEWDNLLILDSLRYDYFKEYNQLKGTLEPVISRGSNSWEFMKGNFLNREFHDTIYITANAHERKLPDDTFFHIETVFDEWSDPPGTVLPEDIAARARDIHKKYPDKALIVHFMQPHGPHLGPTANSYRERYDIRQDGLKWNIAGERGILTKEEIRRAYKETLIRVLNVVANFADEIDGKTVITADHGQLLGEQILPFTDPKYGHPHDIHVPELRLVPWFEVENGSRRNIKVDEPLKHDRASKNVIKQRLEALGYH